MYPQGPAAYDRAITVFSPDGRLFQVEYAREAVKRGTTAVGISYAGGVLLAVDKNVATSLIIPSSVEKIFKIDDHIGIATSGLVADARRLIEEARIKAQRHRLAYNEPITVSQLTRELCDIKQLYTQFGGARPFGTALLIAGVNNRPHVFESDPSGAYTEYKATSIGMGKRDVEKVFEEKYKDGLSRKQALEVALFGLNAVSESKLKKENIDMISIESKNKYTRVSADEIGKSLDDLKSELESRRKGKKKSESEKVEDDKSG
ncbi:MAG: archaeal proteasome endopeptidase complex subunit alpha [Candidatus Altiarchaeota archaeon]